jgi:hypothetical protein
MVPNLGFELELKQRELKADFMELVLLQPQQLEQHFILIKVTLNLVQKVLLLLL